MHTKEKILHAALKLYNSAGINEITSRHIAEHLGISSGNLHYHFKHTEDIIKALYYQLSGEFDELMLQTKLSKKNGLALIDELAVSAFKLQYRYRFIFLHFVEIGWRIPTVRKNYLQLTKRRTKEFLTIFSRMVKDGIFRSDLPNSTWKLLVAQIFIVADFWMSYNEITSRLAGKKAVDEYRKMFITMFSPYTNNNIIKKPRRSFRSTEFNGKLK